MAIENKSMCWYTNNWLDVGKLLPPGLEEYHPSPTPQDIIEPSRDLKKNTKEVTKNYNVYCSFNNFGVNHLKIT